MHCDSSKWQNIYISNYIVVYIYIYIVIDVVGLLVLCVYI